MLKALLRAAALAVLAVAARAQAATPISTAFTKVGESTFVVPPGVHRVDVSLTGARGGDWASQGLGGRGATVLGSLPVTPGMTLYAEVGGPGTGRRASPTRSSQAARTAAAPARPAAAAPRTFALSRRRSRARSRPGSRSRPAAAAPACATSRR